MIKPLSEMTLEEKLEMGRLMARVNREILKERDRQNRKWGIQRHPTGEWLKILVEEVGELAQAMQIGTKQHKNTDANDPYMEAIHVSAVAAAIAEQFLEQSLDWEDGN